jgi:CHAT domain-containing protein
LGQSRDLTIIVGDMRVLRFAVAFLAGSLALSALQLEAPLAPGATVSRSLRATERHAYVVPVAAGQCVQAAVTSRQSGTRLRIAGPGGATRELTIGTQGGGARPDPMTFVADAAGEVRLEISAGATAAEYSLTLQAVRVASESDRRRASAEQSYWDAHTIYAKRGVENFRRALAMFEQSLARWQALGDQWFEGNVLNEIGGLHRLLAQNDEALAYYNKALPVLRASGNLREQTGTLNNIAAIFYSRGEVRAAFEYFDQSLQLAQSTGDRQAQSILVNNMGTLALAQGQHQRALDLFNQALVLRRAVQDRAGEARTLNNLSLIYRLLGDNASSKDVARQALSLSEQIADRQLQAASLNSLGTIERIAGEAEQAEQHLQQALALFRESGEARLAGATLNNLGELHAAQGRRDLARREFEQALAESRRAEERQREAYTLRNLGSLAIAERQHDLAWTRLEQSLEIERAIRNQEGEAESLRDMARIRSAQGRVDQALTHSTAALTIVESLRSKVGNPQLRTTYFSSKRAFYELHVDLLMNDEASDRASGALAAALEASERARARSLGDLLRETGISIREGVDAALLQREEALRQRINVVESSRVRALAGKPDPQQLAAIERDLDGLFRDYQQVQADIRVRSPQYAAISQAEAFRLDEIQQALDPDTVLLEYLLGDQRSYVWAVSNTAIAGYVLPARVTIENLVREVYPRIAREAATTPGGRQLADDVLRRTTSELSRVLLGPVASHLGRKRLVVVADGALLYVPFTLLDSPAAPARPLLVDHEVVHLPSMSSLLTMRQTRKTTPVDAPSVGVIADPVFAPEDSRIAGRQPRADALSTSSPARDDLARSAADGGVVQFPRLRFTRQEAAGIAALVPESRRFQALDFAASRQTATGDRFARQTILHFATHGLINSAHPELSGLVLSLVDPRGQPQDGFLRLHDIYNLKLDAALVVLSACQTALGKDIRGEGLIGLTRGFMYAGAPRVVASLWAVEDRATAELMKRFYEGMLKRGLTASAALRDAQLALRRDRRWSDPYYWGAFVLQGEWR